MIVGREAINAKKTAPASVNLLSTLAKYSSVDFPGHIPGMNPFEFFILSATSSGLNVIDI